MPLALAGAVSLPGLCCLCTSFGQAGFDLLVVLGYCTVLSKTYIKTLKLKREGQGPVMGETRPSWCEESAFPLFFAAVTLFMSWVHVLDVDNPFIYPSCFQQIWDKTSLECLKVLTGHTGSVLCLQYDERVIVTGSSDSTVR